MDFHRETEDRKSRFRVVKTSSGNWIHGVLEDSPEVLQISGNVLERLFL